MATQTATLDKMVETVTVIVCRGCDMGYISVTGQLLEGVPPTDKGLKLISRGYCNPCVEAIKCSERDSAAELGYTQMK